MSMIFIITGFTAFLLYIIYDINSVKHLSRIFHGFFAVGSALLIISTAGAAVLGYLEIHPALSQMIAFGIPACIFMAILVYTLFLHFLLMKYM